MKDYPYPMQARNEALCPFTRDTQLSGFLTLPKSLLCWGLSPGALLVYGLLLDRGKLSQRSGWTDKQGWVYVIFPVRELALALLEDPHARKDDDRTAVVILLSRRGESERSGPVGTSA